MTQALWTYSLRWSLPQQPCPGPRQLASADVPAGSPCPSAIMALWKPGRGYAICLDFPPPAPVRRWSDERKAAARRRNLARRIEKKAPLFAEEFIERELSARPSYFACKDRADRKTVSDVRPPSTRQGGHDDADQT